MDDDDGGARTGEEEESGVVMNRFSRTLTQKKSQGASQAMLYATGLTTEDMNKAQVRVFRCGIFLSSIRPIL